MIEPCLLDNKICSKHNQRCETCMLDDCKETIRMIETHEQRIRRIQEENIRKQLPASCRKCNFIEFVSIKEKKLYCPYMIKDCIIK